MSSHLYAMDNLTIC
uniref:Uncharacterized protein n=1 Tax=Anguilla anguilla TaxID=7936 RepID=A0A0E9UAC9_ANGAN